MSQPAESIMGRLKADTDDLHRMAEGRDLQKSLARGTLPQEVYGAFLGQMYLVHRALEAALDSARDRHRAFAAVVRDYHRRQENLREDLRFLEADPEAIEPVPATSVMIDLIDRTAAENPVALLGVLYVLEGSTNGAKFIAKALARAWGFEPGPGLSYMDPHRDLQKDRWQAFKRDMDAVDFTGPECEQLIEAARATFRAVADISDELQAPAAVA